MPKFETLSKELLERMDREKRENTYQNYRFDESKILRRKVEQDGAAFWSTPFVRDIDKIMQSPYFSRYADKTQV